MSISINGRAIVHTVRTYAVDLGERVAATFLMAAGGVLITADAGNVGHVSFWQGVAAGGVAATGSLLTGLGARFLGDPNSASLLPARATITSTVAPPAAVVPTQDGA